jgi:hypothetical protein
MSHPCPYCGEELHVVGGMTTELRRRIRVLEAQLREQQDASHVDGRVKGAASIEKDPGYASFLKMSQKGRRDGVYLASGC